MCKNGMCMCSLKEFGSSEEWLLKTVFVTTGVHGLKCDNNISTFWGSDSQDGDTDSNDDEPLLPKRESRKVNVVNQK